MGKTNYCHIKKIISAYEHGVCGVYVTGLAAGMETGRLRFICNP